VRAGGIGERRPARPTASLIFRDEGAPAGVIGAGR
jgi:hypothetical protein